MTHIIQSIKLLFCKEKELYRALKSITGFYPHNIDLYRRALAHRSMGIRDREGRSVNNERLEFLGDAIIEAAVSDIIFRHFVRKPEGFLTETRSKLVQRETLNRLSTELGIDNLVRVAGHSSGHNNHTGGNAFEALVGAIYLDRGYKAVLSFLDKRILAQNLNIDKVARREVNFKSKLLEWSQRNRIKADFQPDTTEREGTDSPVFNTRVVLEGVVAGHGTGYSKKESHQNAARNTLSLLSDKGFLEKVLLSKEKRTAMEADLISAPPRLDQITGGELRTERPVSRRTHRRAEAARTGADSADSEKKEARRSSRRKTEGKEKSDATQQPAVPSESDTLTGIQTGAGSTQDTQAANAQSNKKPRRSHRPRPRRQAESAESTAAAGIEPGTAPQQHSAGNAPHTGAAPAPPQTEGPKAETATAEN